MQVSRLSGWKVLFAFRFTSPQHSLRHLAITCPFASTFLTRHTLGDTQHLQHGLIAHDVMRHVALVVLVIVELDLRQHRVLVRRVVVYRGPLPVHEGRDIVSMSFQSRDPFLHLSALGLDRGAECRAGRAAGSGCRGGPGS